MKRSCKSTEHVQGGPNPSSATKTPLVGIRCGGMWLLSCPFLAAFNKQESQAQSQTCCWSCLFTGLEEERLQCCLALQVSLVGKDHCCRDRGCPVLQGSSGRKPRSPSPGLCLLSLCQDRGDISPAHLVPSSRPQNKGPSAAGSGLAFLQASPSLARACAPPTPWDCKKRRAARPRALNPPSRPCHMTPGHSFLNGDDIHSRGSMGSFLN